MKRLAYYLLLPIAFIAAITTTAADNVNEVVTEITFGNNTPDAVIIYISPSCRHCFEFVSKDLNKFLKRCGGAHNVVLRFLPTSPVDIFLIKLFLQRAQGQTCFYNEFSAFMAFVFNNMMKSVPTNEQISRYQQDDDSEDLIKYQALAEKYGFTEKEIKNARPNKNGVTEKNIMLAYGQYSEQIQTIHDSNEISLPLIIQHDAELQNLPNC